MHYNSTTPIMMDKIKNPSLDYSYWEKEKKLFINDPKVNVDKTLGTCMIYNPTSLFPW